MEGDDDGCTYHPTSNRGNMAHLQASLNENRRMEGDDVGCTYHLTTNQGNMAHHQASLNDNRRMVVTGRNN